MSAIRGCIHVTAMVMQFRGRREISRCRCIAALAACLDLVPQQDLDFPWPAKKVPGWRVGPAADPVVEENYLTWTSDCSKLAQVAIHLHPSRALCTSKLSGMPNAAAKTHVDTLYALF